MLLLLRWSLFLLLCWWLLLRCTRFALCSRSIFRIRLRLLLGCSFCWWLLGSTFCNLLIYWLYLRRRPICLFLLPSCLLFSFLLHLIKLLSDLSKSEGCILENLIFRYAFRYYFSHYQLEGN